MFFIEVAPNSSRGAICKLPGCYNNIRPGAYRLAVYPGMDSMSGRYRGRDLGMVDLISLIVPAICLTYTFSLYLYHIKYFEKVADFSQSDSNKRLLPVKRTNFNLRGLTGSQTFNGKYLCDGGAERLVLEFKSARGRLFDARDGVENGEPITPA